MDMGATFQKGQAASFRESYLQPNKTFENGAVQDTEASYNEGKHCNNEIDYFVFE